MIPGSLPMMYDVGGNTLGVGVYKQFVGVVLISDRISVDDETMSVK